ncbi:MAG: RHS repeat-associated core domain-containing protein [Terriglobia bacterium]
MGEKRVGFDVNGGIVFLHQNNLNSVTFPTTFDGSMFDDILYYPWGQYWEGEGFVFAGMDHFWEDVLHNTPNRQYAFYEGRWLSPDPLAGDVTDPQSLNRYAYVQNNPCNASDPLGLVRTPPAVHGGEGGAYCSSCTIYMRFGLEGYETSSCECTLVPGTGGAKVPPDRDKGGGASANCGNLVYIQGGHANFSIDCGSALGGDCAGRSAGGLHIEGNPKEGFWGHNDTASYYIGQSFNWGTFSPWNLFLHGGVDYLWGNVVITMFPY